MNEFVMVAIYKYLTGFLRYPIALDDRIKSDVHFPCFTVWVGSQELFSDMYRCKLNLWRLDENTVIGDGQLEIAAKWKPQKLNDTDYDFCNELMGYIKQQKPEWLTNSVPVNPEKSC